MSTALYRRYRPETFAEVIGQEHVTEPLMVALEKNRVNHAYLFSGPRGCGKTTSARILARCLNCAQGPTPTPCGVCDSCRELSRDGGGSLDVIEMDAASHGGVDHARDLRERATLAPVRDRYKIFIIDEAHMVTREGFNALLKIVEEPPEHVKFIFATTEPNKVLGTIRSRTHHYPFRLVPPEVLLPFLQGLCDQEQVPVEPGVLQLVIRAGGGSVRDSLSILDQLMAGASSQNGIEYDRAVALLGYTHAQLLDEVIEALGAKDAPTLFGAVSRVVATGQDPRRFVEDLLERLRDLIVVKAVPQAAGQILQGVPQDQLERLAQQAQALGERELTVAAGTVNETLNGMTGAANPQLQLELLCARLLLPAAEGSAGGAEVAALASRLQVLERRVASGAAGSVPAQGGMSAARAAGMAAAGLAPKTPASKTQAPHAQAPSAPTQEAVQETAQSAQQPTSEQVAPQQTSAGAPPLAGAPLSTAPLSSAPLAPTAQAPAAGAPLAGNAPAAPHAPQAPNAPASAAADAATAGTPSAPLKLNPNDPLAAVQGNWRAILNRMSVPGAAEQLMKVRPARMDGATLYVSADIATLRAVKGFVPELTARVSEFLRRQVTIHAQVAKPSEQVKSGEQANPAVQPTPAAQPAAPSAPPTPSSPAAQPVAPAAPAPQAPQQPVEQTPPQPAQPAPLADGPRGGEDAWRRHGQPLTGANAPESTSVDAPLGAWEVAPIPQSAPEEAPQQATPAVPQAPAGPLAPEPPLPQQVSAVQQVPVAPAGGFGERDSFAASGSGVPQQESTAESQQAQAPPFSQEPSHVEEPPYEEEPPFEDEPPYAEPVEAPAAPTMPAEPVAPAGPLATPVEPAGPLAAGPLAAAPLVAPVAPAGPLATPPQAAPADNAPAAEEKPAQPAAPASNAPAAPARAASEEDYVSEDDEKVENSTFIGLRAIEKIIGGTVIDERPLHQP